MRLVPSWPAAALLALLGAVLLWWMPGALGVRWPLGDGRSSRQRARSGAPDGSGERAILLAMVDGMVAALRAGAAPAATVATAARLAAARLSDRPCGVVLAVVADRAAAGDDLADTWAAAVDELSPGPRQAVAAVARAWTLAAQLGAPLAPGLQVSAATLRGELERDRRIRAASAGPRATMQVLTLLPVAGLGLASLAGLQPWPVLASPLALVTVVPGGGLILLGRLIARRMIVAAARPARVPA